VGGIESNPEGYANLSDGVRFALKHFVQADLVNGKTDKANKALIINKHDKAHLLHLQMDPTAAALWSEALHEKSWVQLDDQDGQGGNVCPWKSLANLFNDPTNSYTNVCVVLNQMDESGCSVLE